MSSDAFMARIAERLRNSPRYPGAEERAAAFEVTEESSGIVGEDTFWSRVAEETSRSTRYGHPFTILVLRQRSAEGSLRSLGSSLLDVVDRRFVRETDVVTFLRRELAMGILLPQTNAKEAVDLVERMQQTRRERSGYQTAVMEYPADAEQIRALSRSR